MIKTFLLDDSEGALLILNNSFLKELQAMSFSHPVKAAFLILMLWGGGKKMACTKEKKKNNGQSCEQGVITMSDTI